MNNQILPEVISTGSLRLDQALQTGGFPRGEIIEIFGPDSSGKTTLCLNILAEAITLGGDCAFLDADQSLNRNFAQACGVDLSHLYFSSCNEAEQVIDTLETLVNSAGISAIALDSLSSLVMRAELSAPLGNTHAYPIDPLIARALERLKPVLRSSRTTLLITNLEHPKRQAVYHNLAGNTSRLSLKLHAAIRLQLKPSGPAYRDNQAVGLGCQIRVVKNSFASYPQVLKLDIMYNDGVIKHGEILDCGVQSGIIQSETGTYSYRGQVLGSSFLKSVAFLQANARLSEEIAAEIRSNLNLGAVL